MFQFANSSARVFKVGPSRPATLPATARIRAPSPLDSFRFRRNESIAKIAPGKLADVELPALLLSSDGDVDLVWSITRDALDHVMTFHASEPGQPGVRLGVPADEIVAASSGQIVLLRPAADQDYRTASLAQNGKRSWFLSAFLDSRKVYGEAIAASLAINILALAVPLFTMNVYDRVLPNAAAETLWALAIGVIIATLFDLVIKTLRGHFVDAAARRADVVLSNLIYARLIGARQQANSASAGVRANTLRELDTLRDFFNSATLTAFGDLPFLFILIGMIGVVAGSLVLVPIAAIPIVLAIAWATQRAIGNLMAAQVRQSALKHAIAVETVVGLDSIKAAGAESWAASMWEKATAESIRTSNELRRYTNFGINLVQTVQTLTQVLMVIVGFYMSAAGTLTTGGLIAATILAGRAMQPLAQMAGLIARMHQTRLSYQLLNEIVAAPQERPDEGGFVATTVNSGSIVFEDVTVRYEKESPPALSDVSFSIAAGERVGLLGGIGSGKSTLLKLVPALYAPSQGRVLIDGIPASQLDPAILQAQVGFALQQGELFHGTIRTNICLANPAAADEELLDAARVSCALDWILRLPKGFETPVRERGIGLSGGQRQTLILARALLAKPFSACRVRGSNLRRSRK